MNYQELRKAAEILGIKERASLQQIRQRYRELVKQHHPDKNSKSCEENIRKINAAYEILKGYCRTYKYCFSEEEFLEQEPTERLRRQFGWDPVWSGTNSKGHTE